MAEIPLRLALRRSAPIAHKMDHALWRPQSSAPIAHTRPYVAPRRSAGSWLARVLGSRPIAGGGGGIVQLRLSRHHPPRGP
ncbi:hypothetical protein GGTG_01310 [Gaeumannomyces tritici R3-111a-1]|uniref:Uncharacterized protein n=1 Tax=Gaeumannomyces tritici (strain R3-111a-1) TaxID=644352 RepID=J3NJ76_GAET3|nr:hypothetical protein GGTG_01310 [Gaeumannomyces tritici R3-111a-1]EJT81327.1 hypothetical protein GGTG_01310 [Gaeumannomyces tritici R3-111a-1]